MELIVPKKNSEKLGTYSLSSVFSVTMVNHYLTIYPNDLNLITIIAGH